MSYRFLFLAPALLGAVLMARPAAAQGTISSIQRPLMPSDIENFARRANRGAVPLSEQMGLLSTGAITLNEVYFDPTWQPGVLTMPDGSTRRIAGLRYNVLARVIEVRDSLGSDTPHRLLAHELRAFTSDGRTFGTLPLEGEKRIFQDLTAGPLHLLLLPEVQLVPAVRNEALNIDLQPASYNRNMRLFAMYLGQKGPRALALDRKQVLKLFGTQSEAMARYADEHNISFTDVNGVTRLVDYYNTTLATAEAK